MEMPKEIKLTNRQQYWLEHIQSCELAGISLARYAKENSINLQSMYTSKATLISKGVLSKPNRPRFQRAQLKVTSPKNDWRICLPNGLSVMIPDLSDEKTLARILRVASNI